MPKAIDANQLGHGSAVTKTTWGTRPFRLRIKLNASDLAFCALSLLKVNLQEMLACNMGIVLFKLRIGVSLDAEVLVRGPLTSHRGCPASRVPVQPETLWSCLLSPGLQITSE